MEHFLVVLVGAAVAAAVAAPIAYRNGRRDARRKMAGATSKLSIEVDTSQAIGALKQFEARCSEVGDAARDTLEELSKMLRGLGVDFRSAKEAAAPALGDRCPACGNDPDGILCECSFADIVAAAKLAANAGVRSALDSAADELLEEARTASEPAYIASMQVAAAIVRHHNAPPYFAPSS